MKLPSVGGKLKATASRKLLSKFQKNYSIIKKAFQEKDLSKQTKFLRWLKIHKNFYTGAFATISRGQRKHLVEASLELEKIFSAVQGQHIDEPTCKIVVKACDDLISLLERTKKAL